MEAVDIPSFFLCPISIEIMRDPVTLSTGITYNRDTIERWMFSEGKHTCPVTNQSLPDSDLTPNFLASKITTCDEALKILHSLQISEQGLLDLIAKNGDFIDSLTSKLQQRSSYKSRVYATLILKSILAVIAPTRLIGLKEELFKEIMNILRDGISHQATRAALQILGGICPWGRNRIKAVDAGAVPVLIELLLEEPERRECEMVLMVLDRLCGCAEGRAEIVRHAAGIAVVSKKIIRVSEVASERAVRILHSISRFSATPAVLQEMLQVGAVNKLCLLVQVGCGMMVKEKAGEILRLHCRVWKKSPCVSPQLQPFFPSS